MKIGAARKIDEYVPTITPMFIANAKFFTRPVPKMFMISVVANTVDDVRIVRDEHLVERDVDDALDLLVLELGLVLADSVEHDHGVVDRVAHDGQQAGDRRQRDLGPGDRESS